MVFASSPRQIIYDLKFPGHLPGLAKTMSEADANDNKLCWQAVGNNL
jgi:hypothetical protein